MALKKQFLKRGTVYTAFASSDGGFDLLRWLKKWLSYLGITTYDPCCDTASVVRPLRYNTTGDNTTEYYNGTAWVSTWIRNSSVINWANIATLSAVTNTIAATGAQVGDPVVLGLPNHTAPVDTGIIWTAWVSATDVVSVKAYNTTASGIDLASGTYRIAVLRS